MSLSICSDASTHSRAMYILRCLDTAFDHTADGRYFKTPSDVTRMLYIRVTNRVFLDLLERRRNNVRVCYPAYIGSQTAFIIFIPLHLLRLPELCDPSCHPEIPTGNICDERRATAYTTQSEQCPSESTLSVLTDLNQFPFISVFSSILCLLCKIASGP